MTVFHIGGLFNMILFELQVYNVVIMPQFAWVFIRWYTGLQCQTGCNNEDEGWRLWRKSQRPEKAEAKDAKTERITR